MVIHGLLRVQYMAATRNYGHTMGMRQRAREFALPLWRFLGHTSIMSYSPSVIVTVTDAEINVKIFD